MKKNNGITLIALIITIIIMLILVAVSVSILINSGLIGKAKEAGSKTKTAYGQESRMGDSLTINGVTYNSIDEYLADLNSSNPAGTLTITTSEIETESRAVILKACIGEEPIVNAEYLQEVEQEDVERIQQMFVVACQKRGGLFTEWSDIINDMNGNEETTITDAFMYYGLDNGFTDAYNFILETDSYIEDFDENAFITCNGQTVIGNRAEFVIAKNGSYTVTAANEDGTGTTSVNITHCEVEEYSEIQTTKQTLTIDGFTVTVPEGFAYGTSTNVGHVTTGLVITDSIENVNGKNYSNGNEFVWIPVDENLKVGTASNNKVMARISSGTDYEGVLYNFYGTGSSTYSEEKTNYGVSTTSYREPAYLTHSSYGDASSYNTIGLTQNSLQTEYNNMIASIKANKGFYVGRYEMGIENNKAVSKLGITPASAYDGCTNEETGEGALRWWGLYDKAKTYTNNSNSVQGYMICGAEWDAVLNFALEGSDKEKVGQRAYASTKPQKTGAIIYEAAGSDKIINIYDLTGNMTEITMEASSNMHRVYRGR